MVDLVAKTPMQFTSDLLIGTVTLAEVSVDAITSVAPYAGQREALSKALKTHHGVSYPAANRTESAGEASMVWFGHDSAVLMGVAPDAGLSQYAALVDQSDAWCVADLIGTDAREVLARLTPADVRETVFAVGHTMRTQIKHMSGSITRLGPDQYRLMVFRSMAKTLVHDVQEAMERVASRAR